MNKRNSKTESVASIFTGFIMPMANLRPVRFRIVRGVFLIIGILLPLLVIPSPPVQAVYGIYDDFSSNVIYTGAWSSSFTAYKRASDASLHWTNVAGASASFTFTGISITYKYTMASGRGSADVYIDGVFKKRINAYAPDARFQVAQTWIVPSGIHTIKVQAVGNGNIDLDAFIVDVPFADSANATFYDDTSGLVTYVHDTVNWSHLLFPNAYNGTISQSNIQQDAISFNFYGDQIRYIFARASGRGKAVVTIDGVQKEIIGGYSSSNIWQYQLDYRGLGYGIHNIHISNLHEKNPLSNGYVVDLDAFELKPCPGDIHKCRAYAYVELNDANNYTSVGGNLSYASPQIRDGGLSYAVFWMHLQNSGIEVGWAKDTQNGGVPYLYWGYYNPGWKFHKIADYKTSSRFINALYQVHCALYQMLQYDYACVDI